MSFRFKSGAVELSLGSTFKLGVIDPSMHLQMLNLGCEVQICRLSVKLVNWDSSLEAKAHKESRMQAWTLRLELAGWSSSVSASDSFLRLQIQVWSLSSTSKLGATYPSMQFQVSILDFESTVDFMSWGWESSLELLAPALEAETLAPQPQIQIWSFRLKA